MVDAISCRKEEIHNETIHIKTAVVASLLNSLIYTQSDAFNETTPACERLVTGVTTACYDF